MVDVGALVVGTDDPSVVVVGPAVFAFGVAVQPVDAITARQQTAVDTAMAAPDLGKRILRPMVVNTSPRVEKFRRAEGDALPGIGTGDYVILQGRTPDLAGELHSLTEVAVSMEHWQVCGPSAQPQWPYGSIEPAISPDITQELWASFM